MSRTKRRYPILIHNNRSCMVSVAHLTSEREELTRDKKPWSIKRWPCSDSPKGYNTWEDDHGLYGPSGQKWIKRETSKLLRRRYKKEIRNELRS